MNLHSIVAPVISAINPNLLCSLQASTGYATVNFVQTPTYAAPVQVQVQLQALSWSDLKQLDGLNIVGTRKAAYIYGAWFGEQRSTSKGGDLLTTPDGQVWLVAYVLENWDITANWTKVCLTLQDGS